MAAEAKFHQHVNSLSKDFFFLIHKFIDKNKNNGSFGRSQNNTVKQLSFN